MPTQLQLEGRELAPLLDRVRSELGPLARILSAEKIRTGGIGGFFARQRFELTVEVDDLPLPPAATTAPTAPASLLELADRVSDHEHAAAVSTEAPSFTSLLLRLGVSIDGSPLVGVPHQPPATAAAPVSTAAPVSAAPPVSAATSVPVPVPAPRRADEHTVTTAAVVPSGSTPWSAPGTLPVVATTSALATRDPAAGQTAVAPHQAAPHEPALRQPASRQAALSQPASRQAALLQPALPAAAATPPAEHVRSTDALSRLGLPAHLLPVDSNEAVYPALLQALRRLPKVPRTTNRAGEVLAVVGPLHLALDVARELARDLGLPLASAVFLATTGPVDTEVSARQQLQDVDTAASCRATWRRRRNLVVVAVDAPLTSAGAEQARSYLAALGPTAVWGVVEATRKAHDVGAWTRAVGGVHALALTGVEETADPAAVLALGIPVGRLGSRPASPAVWASLLTGRLVS